MRPEIFIQEMIDMIRDAKLAMLEMRTLTKCDN